MSLQIRATPHQLADLKRISNVEARALDSVKQRLQQLDKPTLNPQQLVSAVKEILDAEAEPVVRQMLSLHGLVRHSGLSIDEVVAGVRGAVEQQGNEVQLDVASWAAIEDSFKSLVQDRSVRLAATAIELSYDYANLLRRTKILTDIRPLFNEEADSIDGAVVSYTLRLYYNSSDGEHELSIALDESDIMALGSQCERAIKKAQTAQSLVAEQCNIPVTVAGDTNDG